MQTYNQFNQGNIMPLLMNFTTPTPIQEAEDVKFTYNDGEQISYEMRIIGTRSLKNNRTWVRKTGPNSGLTKTDKANEIDDSKTVR